MHFQQMNLSVYWVFVYVHVGDYLALVSPLRAGVDATLAAFSELVICQSRVDPLPVIGIIYLCNTTVLTYLLSTQNPGAAIVTSLSDQPLIPVRNLVTDFQEVSYGF